MYLLKQAVFGWIKCLVDFSYFKFEAEQQHCFLCLVCVVSVSLLEEPSNGAVWRLGSQREAFHRGRAGLTFRNNTSS